MTKKIDEITNPADSNGVLASFKDIMDRQKLRTEEVEVPEWGGRVIVQEVTKDQQNRIRASARKPNGEIDAEKMERLLVLECMVTPKITTDQYQLLGSTAASAFEKVLSAIMELSAMNPSDKEVDEDTASFPG